jgi:hypothetical protein
MIRACFPLACVALAAVACSLNPQPLPPLTGDDSGGTGAGRPDGGVLSAYGDSGGVGNEGGKTPPHPRGDSGGPDADDSDALPTTSDAGSPEAGPGEDAGIDAERDAQEDASSEASPDGAADDAGEPADGGALTRR